MENKRQYVGNGKAVSGYPLVNISVCLNDIPNDAIYLSESNGKKYLRLTVGEKRDGVDQYGNSHSVWINDYKPQGEQSAAAPAPAPSKSAKSDDGLPF